MHLLAFGVPSGPDLIILLVIVLVLFGAKKLPELARGLGKSMREFKKAASGVEEEFKRALAEEEPQKPVTILPPAPVAAPVSDPVLSAPVQPVTPVTEKPHGHADV